MLIEFAAEMHMKIMRTHFDNKEIHKETWISPNGLVQNQIDHLLIEKKYARTIKDCRNYRGADTAVTMSYLLLLH